MGLSLKGRSHDIPSSPHKIALIINGIEPDCRNWARRTESTSSGQFAGMTKVETQPRGFNLSEDGRFMVVAGEKASSVGLYRLNAETGLAKKVDEAPTDTGANWVEIITVIE